MKKEGQNVYILITVLQFTDELQINQIIVIPTATNLFQSHSIHHFSNNLLINYNNLLNYQIILTLNLLTFSRNSQIYLMEEEVSTQGIKIKAFKVILVGTQSVGKSSVLNRISDGRFSNNYTPTIGIDFKTYTVDIRSRAYSLQIWDTAGQQKFRALTSSYYKGAHGCVCVFDLSDLQTLQKCDYYIQKALQQNIPNECIYLIGNKNDLGQTYSKEGQQFAQKYQINYGVGSAKNGEGLTSIFNNLASKMVSKFGGEAKNQGMELKPKLLITERKNCKC